MPTSIRLTDCFSRWDLLSDEVQPAVLVGMGYFDPLKRKFAKNIAIEARLFIAMVSRLTPPDLASFKASVMLERDDVMSPEIEGQLSRATQIIRFDAELSVPNRILLASFILKMNAAMDAFSTADISSVLTSLNQNTATISSNINQMLEAKSRAFIERVLDDSEPDKKRFKLTATGMVIINNLLD